MDFANEDLPVPQEVILSTVEVVNKSSAIYSGSKKGEKYRRENLGPCLSAAIGHSIEHISNADGTELDGTILHRPANVANGESVALLLSEIKDEMGMGGSNPSIQGGLSVHHFWAQRNCTTYRNATYCPTLILTVAGPWMAVFGAVFINKLIIEPLNSVHYRRIA
ncbi:hypothetical protein ARMGADRAFT_1090628 [Armillaria gallica]|uniref:Uncharacterized protein n=1 Tax=Armillaria gallica TaxID=47427 RepID=A0A2H3CL48_ARMGA|nr:hypothetical protein ARMGADRAFT_1090628 [Armillaria gallica]